ncbi:MAG TPA: hypothetical protein DD666_00755 [Advenella kashmirensis]|uniref:Uncharacterized protein n=1 Tax=Advenella kashmirensis TaxID=310575 RepID=A0A356LAS9_9BURK|nr:hypothetical protein [Advenella kashmirensis]
MTAYPARMYRDPSKIAEENEIAALRRQKRKHSNPFEELPMTADDLLHNWARGEWAGDYPWPLPPNRCASAEGDYQAPSDLDQPDPPPPPINWDLHRLVHAYYTNLARMHQRILQAEYTRRHEFGDLSKNARQEKAGRILGMGVHKYRAILDEMKADIEARWRKR